MIPGNSKRLLLVEDNSLIRKMTSGRLVAAGYVVRTAIDGLDAITKLRAGLPDVIVSDLMMPRLAGPELLGVVRKRFPQIPFVVISGEPPDKMPEGVAADAYCQKNGGGIDHLLETLSDLTTKLPPRTDPPPVDKQPAPARRDANGDYIVHCDECLREFRVPRVFRLAPDQDWAICVHCENFVEFRVVEGSNPG